MNKISLVPEYITPEIPPLFDIFKELDNQYDLLANKNNSLKDRIVAFESIIDSEVGDTALIRGRSLERELKIRQLYLKFEGGNPTGTQKDRIAFALCQDALRRGYDSITLATCGNYGVACALAAKIAGLRSIIYVPENYHTKRIVEMKKLGADIRRISGDYERTVEVSQHFAALNETSTYDANPGGANASLQIKAYSEIAYEIYDELRDAPKIVACPVSNGTMLLGLYQGFSRLYRRGKTSRIPRLVAGSATGKNPIVASFLSGKISCEDLNPLQIKETPINEPLINWHSFDGEEALKAINITNGWAANVSDKRMLELAKLLREREGLNVLPAATAGLAALKNAINPELIQNDRFVVILTSKK